MKVNNDLDLSFSDSKTVLLLTLYFFDNDNLVGNTFLILFFEVLILDRIFLKSLLVGSIMNDL